MRFHIHPCYVLLRNEGFSILKVDSARLERQKRIVYGGDVHVLGDVEFNTEIKAAGDVAVWGMCVSLFYW